jgi:hypothetical protein
MTNNAFAHITPADVEYVLLNSIEVGDILVRHFHTKRQHVSEAPTARQLTRATFTRVDTIDNATTARGYSITEININDEAARVSAVPTINVWRVKRGA